MTPETSSHEHFQHAPDQSALERELNKGLTVIERYSGPLLIACLVAVVVLVGVIIWYRSSASKETAAWTSFSQSRAPEDFLALADKYPNSRVGQWARLEAGKLFVSEGLMQALTNRAASDASLNKARDAYETLLKKSALPELRQEALYGMATCLEALSSGDTKPAIDAYEALLKEFPNSPHKLWAESRIKELKTGNAQEFYAWFRQQNPKPADRPGPKDIPSLESLIPDLEIPSDADSAKAKDGAQAPALPAGAEMPEKKPAEPAGEFPADAKQPAGNTPPAPAMPAEPGAPDPAPAAPEIPAKTESKTEAPPAAKPDVKPESASAAEKPAAPAPAEDAKPATEAR